jgi:molybdopterin synthase catalytic subunit
MVDIFEPVARVMTALQGLSVPVWKVETWSHGLVQWLRRAEEQCTTDGDFDYFP